MKTVQNLLEEKLNNLGYNSSIVKSIISKFDFNSIESKIEEEDIENHIEIIEYEDVTIEFAELFLNIKYDVIHTEILEGDIELSNTENALGMKNAIVDYSLDKRNAAIALVDDYKFMIVIYNPNVKTQNIYKGKTYEQEFKKERDEITKEYYDAFVKNGRVSERKIKEILNLLVSDYVIDEIAVNNLSPRIKMYDNENLYAQNLYAYSLRYINNRTNRIEILTKESDIKRTSKNVQTGTITNDPYIKLDNLPHGADFPLNTISYAWLETNNAGQEEISVFVSDNTYKEAMFSELRNKNSMILELAKEIVRNSRHTDSIDIKEELIVGVLQKLNFELIFPSVDVIQKNIPNKTDTIEPIKYKFRVTNSPDEFEEKLYITIEDGMSGRYSYKLVENALDSLTIIGNKLEYTEESGKFVKKQSVADFNVAAPAAIIRRETFIDSSKIPELLGYIYEDMKYYGTDGLPIPNIEVLFYMPNIASNANKVTMYNGTKKAEDSNKQNFFTNTEVYAEGDGVDFISGGNALPGSTYATVKYINSKGEILKENKVGNVFPKSPFMPDIIPIINDKDGKEWISENKNFVPFIINKEPEQNVIELKYIELFSRVNISCINRDGKKLCDDKSEILQVGTLYDFESKKVFKDSNGDDWKLIFSRPQKLTVKQEEESNSIILVYDIERADVTIRFLNSFEEEIADSVTVQASVDKLYKADKVPYIVDAKGLGWNYNETSNASVVVKNNEENNIALKYEPAKTKVIVRLKNEEGANISDEKIEFVQVGSKYTIKYDNEVVDFTLKEWNLKKAITTEIVANKDEGKNILEAVYEPKLAKATIKFVTENGQPIKNPIVENAQVGGVYNPKGKTEIKDNFGKVWTCINSGAGITISNKENENDIVLKYKPLMSEVLIKYFDIEGNVLIEPKKEIIQVGSEYKNSPIRKVTDKMRKEMDA